MEFQNVLHATYKISYVKCLNTFADHYKCFPISRSFHFNKHLLEIEIPDCTKPPISGTRDTRVLLAAHFQRGRITTHLLTAFIGAEVTRAEFARLKRDRGR